MPKLKVKTTASCQGQISGAETTIGNYEQSLANELLRCIVELASKTQWYGDYKQSVMVLPKTGDDTKFVVTWERED